MTNLELLNTILSLSILEMNALIDNLEKKLNINNLSFATEKENISEVNNEKKDVFNCSIILQSLKSDKKISVLKTVKGLLNIGLKETKEIVENLPHLIKETSNIKEAEEIKQQLESSGAIVEIKKL